MKTSPEKRKWSKAAYKHPRPKVKSRFIVAREMEIIIRRFRSQCRIMGRNPSEVLRTFVRKYAGIEP